MGKGLHKVFLTVVKDIQQDLPPSVKSVSEFSHFVPERRNFDAVTKFSFDIRKPLLQVTLKEINNLINNQNFLIGDTDKDEPVTPCMGVYKAKIQSDGSIDKLKLIIVIRGDLQHK